MGFQDKGQHKAEEAQGAIKQNVACQPQRLTWLLARSARREQGGDEKPAPPAVRGGAGSRVGRASLLALHQPVRRAWRFRRRGVCGDEVADGVGVGAKVPTMSSVHVAGPVTIPFDGADGVDVVGTSCDLSGTGKGVQAYISGVVVHGGNFVTVFGTAPRDDERDATLSALKVAVSTWHWIWPNRRPAQRSRGRTAHRPVPDRRVDRRATRRRGQAGPEPNVWAIRAAAHGGSPPPRPGALTRRPRIRSWRLGWMHSFRIGALFEDPARR
ncbi:hypothetical protein GCM10009827_114570 [Dactylosporangium maewongense]|uniref:Uncharacterized protein n=1 Tax=Dactylosporangium maewongense TaxID=634393 RepID=A0ABN2DEI7_9ACTN